MRIESAPTLMIEVPERIETERLVIRCPRAGDGEAYHEAIADSIETLKPWLPWANEPQGVDVSEALARKFHAMFIARTDLVFALFERGADGREGRLLGGSGLHRLDWQVRRFEIGYWLRSSHLGRGLVSEAVAALARMAFETLQARRVEIRCDARNERSARVAERCGFELEGTLRSDALDAQGQPRDTRVYARIGNG